MLNCVGWLLKYAAASPSSLSISCGKPSVFMSVRCSLTPILHSLGRDFLVGMRLFTSAPVATSLSLGGMRLKKRWRTRRNSSRARPKPSSPWVIISITYCVITGLLKPRSDSSAKCCQAAVRSLLPLPLLPYARDTGTRALPAGSKLSPSIRRTYRYLIKRHSLSRCFGNSRQH